MNAQINDISTRYEISGQGPWLTLSHSLATDLTMFADQIEILNKHFTVLQYDTRGHGGTTATPGPYSLNQLADDAAALMRYLGITKSHWLGLSMGGMIGQGIALRHPTLIDRIILADTSGQTPAAAVAVWEDRAQTARTQGMAALVPSTLARWFTEPFRNGQPKRMKEVALLISGTPVEGYANCCLAISQNNFLPLLNTLTNAALLIVGEKDESTPLAASQAIADQWRNAKVTVIPDASHISNIEQPALFNAAVLEFLLDTEAGAVPVSL